MTKHQENYLQSARKNMSLGNYIQAIEYLQAEIEQNPCNNETYLLLSDCFVKMEKLSQAKSTLYSLLSKDPNNKSAADRLKKIQNAETTNNNIPNRTNTSKIISSNQTQITNKSSKRKKTPNIASPVVNTTNNGRNVDWSLKNIISSVIGFILLPASILGIVGCFPLHDSFEWAIFVFFILLCLLSFCLILSPRLKPIWKAKNVVFMLLGILFTPIMTGFCIDDFEKNGMCIIFAIICLIWVFAPFFKVD